MIYAILIFLFYNKFLGQIWPIGYKAVVPALLLRLFQVQISVFEMIWYFWNENIIFATTWECLWSVFSDRDDMIKPIFIMGPIKSHNVYLWVSALKNDGEIYIYFQIVTYLEQCVQHINDILLFLSITTSKYWNTTGTL